MRHENNIQYPFFLHYRINLLKKGFQVFRAFWEREREGEKKGVV